jgi:hypothetical protein
VARLMRENELPARRKKAFRLRTTLPGQGAVPNLIKELEPNAPDQIWASDITVQSPQNKRASLPFQRWTLCVFP